MTIPQTIAAAIFLFTLGCCIGSFLNVVIWRLPFRGETVTYRGKTGPLTLSWPDSHCPRCNAGVKWFQNIPIFSWLFLGGRCASCKADISVRYPLVEAGTGVLFIAFFMALFVAHCQPGFTILGQDAAATAMLGVYLAMGAMLLAASGIDADWYVIPEQLTIGLTVLGLVASVAIQGEKFSYMPQLPADDPDLYRTLALGTIGGAVGLILANILLWRKMIPRSFAQMEEEHLQKEIAEEAAKKARGTTDAPNVTPPPTVKQKAPLFVAAGIVIVAIAAGWFTLDAQWASAVTLGGAVLLFLLGVLPRDEGTPDVTQEVMDEISGPDARKEILKELLFVAIPILSAIALMGLPIEVSKAQWVRQLLGSLLGFLAGGGVVWIVRIGATLGFGREAMGLGDAHLMAGVGAIIGGPLVILAFFLAPFLGLVWGITLKIMGKSSVLPYGPWLSIASLFSALFGSSIWTGVMEFMQWAGNGMAPAR